MDQIARKYEYIEQIHGQIAKNLRALREGQYRSISQLARKAGMSWKIIEYWELGKTSPSLDKLLWICEVTGWSLDDILRGVDRGSA